jgi:tetratricopeptide (TPR) repeat protein
MDWTRHLLCSSAVLVCLTSALAAQSANPASLVSLARRLTLQGQHDEALALYRQAMAAAPDLFDAYYGAGIVLDLQGSHLAARREFARAIELAPEESKVQALTGMAVSYVFEGDAPNAARFYRQIAAIQTAAGAYLAAGETANALGRVYLESGDLDEALAWYRNGYDAAKRQPAASAAEADLAELRWAHALARIAARKGDATEAREQTAAVKSLVDAGRNPEQAVYYPYLTGYVAFHLGEYRDAIDELEQADQGDPAVVVLLAQAHEQAGNVSEARRLYEHVLTFNGHGITNAFSRPLAKRKLS